MASAELARAFGDNDIGEGDPEIPLLAGNPADVERGFLFPPRHAPALVGAEGEGEVDVGNEKLVELGNVLAFVEAEDLVGIPGLTETSAARAGLGIAAPQAGGARSTRVEVSLAAWTELGIPSPSAIRADQLAEAELSGFSLVVVEEGPDPEEEPGPGSEFFAAPPSVS